MKLRPEVLQHLVTDRGRRYVRVSRGEPGDPVSVVETSRAVVCMNTPCLMTHHRGTQCAHADVARAHLDALDEQAAAETLCGVAA